MSTTMGPNLSEDDLEPLAESRAGGGGRDVQVTLYEVTRPAQTSLRAPRLLYYGMISGKQVVKIDKETSFICGPGDSLVVPPLQPLTVEFPEASRTPVQFVALRVSQARTANILENIDEVSLDSSVSRQWQLEEQKFCHVEEREGVSRILEMIAYLIQEDPPNRDRLVDLNVRELMIQLLQTRSRPLLIGDFSRHSSVGGLAAAVQHIQDNLNRHISIDELVEEACMSKSTFYRHFSDEFEMSPLEYITRERIVRARELLSNPKNTVTSVSHELGFSSTSHFIDTFKEHEGMTPKQYQLEVTE